MWSDVERAGATLKLDQGGQQEKNTKHRSLHRYKQICISPNECSCRRERKYILFSMHKQENFIYSIGSADEPL